MSSRNHVRMKICGTEFAFSSEDSEAYMMEMGRKVEESMRRLMKQTPTLSVSMAAVFTALNYCDEAAKAKESADNLRVQIKEYLGEASRVQGENDELRRRLEAVTQQLQKQSPGAGKRQGR